MSAIGMSALCQKQTFRPYRERPLWTSEEQSSAWQRDDNFGELAGLHIDVD